MLSDQITTHIASEAALDSPHATRIGGSRAAAPPQQNWVLDRFQDTALIIAAPLLTLALALLAIRIWGMAEGATIVLLVHVVFTVAHHLPTFIRIYGDVELLRRFNWHFIFAPLIAFGVAMSVLVYLNVHDYPLENFLYLYIILTLWDPWHFMRQHYGFMRIYDRHNAAPRVLASRMDFALSSIWFGYILLASGDWLLDLLQDMYTRVQWPMLLMITGESLSHLTIALRNLAVLMSCIYCGYLLWCWNKGYFVSTAKILLCVVTFGVMYLTYTPNVLIQTIAPGWSFKVGFAVIGVVHMTQYLAIVWRYNRGLAARPGRARSGIFRWLHSRGAWWAVGAYVVLCLLYGDVVTTVHNNEWLMALLLALGFTSTMMHYYFDGFIWKVRHRQNQEALEIATMSTGSPASSSACVMGNRAGDILFGANRSKNVAESTESWTTAKQASLLAVLTKQLLYFGVPMAALSIAAMLVWNRPNNGFTADSYIDHMYQAQNLSIQGLNEQATQEARIAFAAMQAQLPVARKRTELQPTSSREAELAFLIYNESLYKNIVMLAVEGRQPTQAQLLDHRMHVHEAVQLLTQAMVRGGSLAHVGRMQFGIEDANKVAASWRKQLGE